MNSQSQSNISSTLSGAKHSIFSLAIKETETHTWYYGTPVLVGWLVHKDSQAGSFDVLLEYNSQHMSWQNTIQ